MTLRHFAYSVFYNDQSSPFWLLKISLYKSDVVFGAAFEKRHTFNGNETFYLHK